MRRSRFPGMGGSRAAFWHPGESAAPHPRACLAFYDTACCGPRSITSAGIYVLGKEEGGRHTPFFSAYQPQFFFRTTNVTGEVVLAEGVETVLPGDNASVIVRLEKPVALDAGSHFAIREGGKT